ncbi:hypothetical protein E4U12_004966, partial [Claviceps purpurea]
RKFAAAASIFVDAAVTGDRIVKKHSDGSHDSKCPSFTDLQGPEQVFIAVFIGRNKATLNIIQLASEVDASEKVVCVLLRCRRLHKQQGLERKSMRCVLNAQMRNFVEANLFIRNASCSDALDPVETLTHEALC